MLLSLPVICKPQAIVEKSPTVIELNEGSRELMNRNKRVSRRFHVNRCPYDSLDALRDLGVNE